MILFLIGFVLGLAIAFALILLTAMAQIWAISDPDENWY
jgi:hypothetical protein